MRERSTEAVSPIISIISLMVIVLMVVAGFVAWGVPRMQNLESSGYYRHALGQSKALVEDMRDLTHDEIGSTRTDTLTLEGGAISAATGFERWKSSYISDSLAFYDDFRHGLDQWYEARGSGWEITNGELINTDAGTNHQLIAKSAALSYFTLETKLKATDPGSANILLSHTATDHYYRLRLNIGVGSPPQLYFMQDGTVERVFDYPAAAPVDDAWYTLSVEFDHGAVNIQWDGEDVGSYTDTTSPYTAGAVGLRSDDHVIHYQYFRITPHQRFTDWQDNDGSVRYTGNGDTARVSPLGPLDGESDGTFASAWWQPQYIWLEGEHCGQFLPTPTAPSASNDRVLQLAVGATASWTVSVPSTATYTAWLRVRSSTAAACAFRATLDDRTILESSTSVGSGYEWHRCSAVNVGSGQTELELRNAGPTSSLLVDLILLTDDHGYAPQDAAGAMGFTERCQWSYRLPVTVGSGDLDRNDAPVVVEVEESSLLAAAGAGATLDLNSTRVIERDGAGHNIGVTTHQTVADPPTVTIVWQLEGVTPQHTRRHFDIYYNTMDASPARPPQFPSSLSVADSGGGGTAMTMENDRVRFEMNEGVPNGGGEGRDHISSVYNKRTGREQLYTPSRLGWALTQWDYGGISADPYDGIDSLAITEEGPVRVTITMEAVHADLRYERAYTLYRNCDWIHITHEVTATAAIDAGDWYFESWWCPGVGGADHDAPDSAYGLGGYNFGPISNYLGPAYTSQETPGLFDGEYLSVPGSVREAGWYAHWDERREEGIGTIWPTRDSTLARYGAKDTEGRYLSLHFEPPALATGERYTLDLWGVVFSNTDGSYVEARAGALRSSVDTFVGAPSAAPTEFVTLGAAPATIVQPYDALRIEIFQHGSTAPVAGCEIISFTALQRQVQVGGQYNDIYLSNGGISSNYPTGRNNEMQPYLLFNTKENTLTLLFIQVEPMGSYAASGGSYLATVRLSHRSAYRWGESAKIGIEIDGDYAPAWYTVLTANEARWKHDPTKNPAAFVGFSKEESAGHPVYRLPQSMTGGETGDRSAPTLKIVYCTVEFWLEGV